MKTQQAIKPIFYLILFFSLISCSENVVVNLDDDTAKILALHHAQREYHFNKDSVAFVNQQSDNFISVNRGEITRPSKEETLARYNKYFSSVEFVQWDDISEPIIKFSDDASMAYTIVDKMVVVSYLDENGEKIESESHFAWMTIYKKYGDEWKIDCVTSTDKP